MKVSDVTLTIENDACLLQATVDSDSYREPFLLWYRFPEEISPFIRADCANAWVATLLLPAMKVGEPLELSVPISRRLLRSVKQIQAVYLAWDPTLSRVDVRAPLQIESPSTGTEVGLFFSSGVDSWYSLLKNTSDQALGEDAITRLIVVHGADIGVGGWKKDVFAKMLANTQTIARELGRQVLWAATNARNFYAKLGISWHWAQGGALASVGLAVENMIRKFYIASWFSYANVLPGGCHPLLDPLWSTESCEFVHDGCEATRQEKLSMVARSSLAMDTLRVCWASESPEFNCGRCSKCQRTMLGLYLAGALERCRTLPSKLDPDALQRMTFIFSHEFRYFQEMLDGLGDSTTDSEIRSALTESLARGKAAFDRMHTALASIDALVPLSEMFILVDADAIRYNLGLGRRVVPFLERDGFDYGPPPDDATAIRELERLRGAGAKYMVFWRDAFWWLDYYVGLNRYLRATFPCVCESESLIVFDLRGAGEARAVSASAADAAT